MFIESTFSIKLVTFELDISHNNKIKINNVYRKNVFNQISSCQFKRFNQHAN